MIEYKNGDILKDNAEALINTVNCVGVMGRGIALQFKKLFPENFKAYSAACDRHEVQPGKLFVFQTNKIVAPKYIINFPTKRHWRDKSLLEDIEIGLKSLVSIIQEYEISSIAIPPLGCGLGGLDWNQVKPLIETALKTLSNSVQVIIYEPNGAPQSEMMTHIHKIPNMTVGRAALIELMHRYLMGMLDPFITLLEVHKLMYFMQEAGQQLKLKFTKAHYGPYSENLCQVLNVIEGHFISGYADGGDKPGKQLKPIPKAIEEATKFLQNHTETKKCFDKVVELVEGFETPFGLELLATVHWLMAKEGWSTMEDLVEQTYAWNNRKKQFTARQIELAATVLVQQGWIKKNSYEKI